jgi:hypothetical protein
MKLTHPLTMGFAPVNPTPSGAYICKGSAQECAQPKNIYHPSQKAWLMERKLYTGRFIVDVGHLPDNLRNL